MPVRFRPDRGRWQLDYRDADGRRVRTLLPKGTSERDARRQLLEAEAAVLRGEAPSSGDATFTDVVGAWARAHRGQWSVSTRKQYHCLMRDHVQPVIGGMRMRSITTADIERLLDGAKSPGVVPGMRRVVVAVCRFAVSRGYADRDPTASLSRRPYKPGSPRYLTREEYQRIVDSPPGDVRNAAILSVWTGLRQGELVALQHDDWTGRHLIVERAWNYHARCIGGTKTGEPRTIPVVVDDALEVLDTYSVHRGWTWPQSAVGRWSWWRSGWETLARRLELPRGTHVLRHTTASWWVQAGGSLMALSRLLGHSSLAMTERYAHLAPDTVDQEARRIWGHMGTQRGHEMSRDAPEGPDEDPRLVPPDPELMN